MNLQLKRWMLLVVVIASVLATDQITKRIIVDHLMLGESRQPVPAISEFFQITRSYNTGSAFGFLPEASDMFLVIALVVVVGIFVYYPRIEGGAWVKRCAIGMVCGGALGNALDRIQYEHVVDFIHYRIPGLVSNVSNVADHAIVLGVALIFFENWMADRRQKLANRREDQAAQTDSGATLPAETTLTSKDGEHEPRA